MTIAIVLNTAWNIYNFRLGLIKALLEQGHRVLAIAPPDDFVLPIETAGARFIPLQQLARKGTNPMRDWKLMRELRGIYRREKVDIALQYTIKPNIYGSLAGYPLSTMTVCTVTGLGYSFLNKGLVNKIARILYRFAFNRADWIFFQNRDDQQLFLNLNLVQATRSGIIPGSGINTKFFHPAFNQPHPNGKLNFLFVGRLLYDKGIRELMQAIQMVCQNHANIHFELIGGVDKGNPSAIAEQPFQAWLAQHPQVKYIGTTKDVRSYLAKTDVVILPSYREGLPRVMLEGLAMAKPLIATDVPGCRETVIHGKNGYLVEVKNAQSLAQAIEKMITLSSEKRIQMGQYGRQLALKRFDEQKIIQQYLEFLDG